MNKNLSMSEALKRGLRSAVILIPVFVFVTLIVVGITNSQSFISALNQFFVALMVNGSWLISLGTLAFVFFMIFIMVHPIGNVRLGGKDAKPEYSMWNWFAISLCSCVVQNIFKDP